MLHWRVRNRGPHPPGGQSSDRSNGPVRVRLHHFGNTSTMTLPKIELLLVSKIVRVWMPSVSNV